MSHIHSTLSKARVDRAISIFRKHGGFLNTTEALRGGIHPSTLYTLRDEGKIERIERGLYRLSDSPPLSNPDLVTVALKVPNGVICLISALSFHEITTQIPHDVHVALKPGAEKPRLEHPPVQIYRFSGAALTAGIETHRVDHISVRIYSVEKTLADCFKFRNRIGLDTVIEALRFYHERKKVNITQLLHYGAICRVSKIMRPYLEALL